MISIITPIYNGKAYIESCIQNVIDQNCSNVEHLLLDGGSKDGTVDIIKHYAERYPHIRWISEKDNGQSDALNKGIKMALGNIIGVLNVDDYYESNVLNRVLDIFPSLPEPSFVAADCNVWAQDGTLLYINRPAKLKLSDLLLGFQVNQYPVNPSAYFYHKSLHQKIGYYDENESYVMDLDFIFKAVQAANHSYIDELWGNFRVLEGTKTFNDQQTKQSGIRKRNILKKFRQDLPPLQRLIVILKYHFYEIYYKVVRAYKNPEKLFKVFAFNK